MKNKEKTVIYIKESNKNKIENILDEELNKNYFEGEVIALMLINKIINISVLIGHNKKEEELIPDFTFNLIKQTMNNFININFIEHENGSNELKENNLSLYFDQYNITQPASPPMERCMCYNNKLIECNITEKSNSLQLKLRKTTTKSLLNEFVKETSIAEERDDSYDNLISDLRDTKENILIKELISPALNNINKSKEKKIIPKKLVVKKKIKKENNETENVDKKLTLDIIDPEANISYPIKNETKIFNKKELDLINEINIERKKYIKELNDKLNKNKNKPADLNIKKPNVNLFLKSDKLTSVDQNGKIIKIKPIDIKALNVEFLKSKIKTSKISVKKQFIKNTNKSIKIEKNKPMNYFQNNFLINETEKQIKERKYYENNFSGFNFYYFKPETGVQMRWENQFKSGGNDLYKKLNKFSMNSFKDAVTIQNTNSNLHFFTNIINNTNSNNNCNEITSSMTSLVKSSSLPDLTQSTSNKSKIKIFEGLRNTDSSNLNNSKIESLNKLKKEANKFFILSKPLFNFQNALQSFDENSEQKNNNLNYKKLKINKSFLRRNISDLNKRSKNKLQKISINKINKFNLNIINNSYWGTDSNNNSNIQTNQNKNEQINYDKKFIKHKRNNSILAPVRIRKNPLKIEGSFS